jgi:PBP1b-binding outer membrane lipoprotein LpoB
MKTLSAILCLAGALVLGGCAKSETPDADPNATANAEKTAAAGKPAVQTSPPMQTNPGFNAEGTIGSKGK